MQNGKELTPDGIRIIIKIDQNGGSFLEIRNVKPEDDAQYMVKATNPAGEASSVARLTVKSKLHTWRFSLHHIMFY